MYPGPKVPGLLTHVAGNRVLKLSLNCHSDNSAAVSLMLEAEYGQPLVPA